MLSLQPSPVSDADKQYEKSVIESKCRTNPAFYMIYTIVFQIPQKFLLVYQLIQHKYNPLLAKAEMLICFCLSAVSSFNWIIFSSVLICSDGMSIFFGLTSSNAFNLSSSSFLRDSIVESLILNLNKSGAG